MAAPKLSLIALVAAVLPIVKADYYSDVGYAVKVIYDLDSKLVTDFCHEYTGKNDYGHGGSTTTVTHAPATTTVTVPCDGHVTPWVKTVSSTTTLYFTTTLTTYVPATTPPAYMKRRSVSAPKIQLRDEFCLEEGKPCRLVQYSDDVVAEACIEFLGGSGVVTTTVTGETATVSVPAATCSPIEKHPEPEPKHEEPEHHEEEEEHGYDGEYGYDATDGGEYGELPESSEG